MFNLDRRYRWYKISLLGPNRRPCLYLFRGVTNNELRIAGTKDTEFEATQFVLSQCVVTVQDWEVELGGTCESLLSHIYKKSGLSEEQLVAEEAILWSKDPEGMMEFAAIATVPGLTLDILRNCDPFDRAKYLMIGKFNFESTWKIGVEEVFNPQSKASASSDPNAPIGSQDIGRDIPLPDKGERSTGIERGFTWSKT